MDIERLTLTKLLERRSLKEAWDLGLRGEVFEDPQSKEIFEFIVTYWLSNGMGEPPTRDVLQNDFPNWEDTGEVNESVQWLVEGLKKRYSSNILQDLVREAAKTSVSDPLGSLNKVFEGSWEAKGLLTPRVSRVDLSKNVQERKRRYTDTRPLSGGVPLGYEEVDDHTGGVLDGELAAVAGFAKTGKSFFLVKAAIEARRAGFIPCVFTLEQSVEEFEDRFDALSTGVGYGLFQKRQLSHTEQDVLNQERDKFATLGPLYIEQPERGERTVQHLVNRARQLGATFLVIDQLSFMESRGFYQSKTDKHAEIIHELKEEITNERLGKLPALLAVQFNRSVASQEAELRGGLHQIANTSAIEQTVDIAYGLYRNKELRANNCMVLDILGSRRSDPKSWLMEWELDKRSSLKIREEYEG